MSDLSDNSDSSDHSESFDHSGNSETWNILYRGPLSSCNYACTYCPFAKTNNTRAELADDATRLDRFADWVAEQSGRRIGILITPWGEAIIRRHYQQAMVRLSHLPQVYRVAVQTNLSCKTAWLTESDRDAIALWTTYHPTQITRERFVKKCAELDRLGVRYSVGTVGLREHFDEIEAIRRELDPSIYVWVNAYKREPGYYQAGEVDRLRAVDPHFDYNRVRHPSRGLACRAGHRSFTVDGEGNARRCHFIPAIIGNIYQPGFADRLRPTLCTNEDCGCHIGYVHRPELGLYEVFGDGVLERIPDQWPAGFNVRSSL